MFPKGSSIFLCLLAVTALYTAGCGSPASQTNSATTNPTSPTSPTSPSTPTESSGTPLAISAPSNGASVSSPFTLTASATTCSSETVTAIGYGLDDATKTVDSASSLSAQITAAAGSHTIHVTAWGSSGAACSASVTVTVAAPAPPANTSPVPSNAINVGSLETLSNWQAQHDPATGASSNGSMSLVSSPAISGQARQFNTSFSSSGGEIYHITWGNDQSAHNFFYDGWVYLNDTATTIANLELDMNQVVSNGDTIIYGFQCDGYSGTWDYTKNAGSRSKPNDTWVHSSAKCNVRNWSRNTWHHIQVSYSRDDSGNVTYHSVWLDDAESKIEATVPSAFSLGWASVLLTNFQIDGLGSGSNTVYLNKLTISRW